MEDYFAAKLRLFKELAPRVSIVNVDDPYGARLAAELERRRSHSRSSARTRPTGPTIQTGLDGSRFRVLTPDGRARARSPLRGRFNVYNVLGALAAARALGSLDDRASRRSPHAGQVPGRFEPVDEGQPFAVLVDYAHTPDSLENVLTAARAANRRAVHVVFGCGGDRDRGKRPLMGEIASRLADRVIVTSDNPRSEDPEAIIEEILAGIGARRAARCRPSRRDRARARRRRAGRRGRDRRQRPRAGPGVRRRPQDPVRRRERRARDALGAGRAARRDETWSARAGRARAPARSCSRPPARPMRRRPEPASRSTRATAGPGDAVRRASRASASRRLVRRAPRSRAGAWGVLTRAEHAGRRGCAAGRRRRRVLAGRGPARGAAALARPRGAASSAPR